MTRVAVGIIIEIGSAFDKYRVLLCQRKQNARYPLKWEFPGGKVEGNESVEECLRRELQEELGIVGNALIPFFRHHHTYADNGRFDVYYYLVQNYTGHLENLAFESFAWVPVHQLPEYDILEGNKEVIAKLLSLHETMESKKY